MLGFTNLRSVLRSNVGNGSSRANGGENALGVPQRAFGNKSSLHGELLDLKRRVSLA